METLTDRFREQFQKTRQMRLKLVEWYAQEDADDYALREKTNVRGDSGQINIPLGRLSIFMNVAAPNQEEQRVYRQAWKKYFWQARDGLRDGLVAEEENNA